MKQIALMAAAAALLISAPVSSAFARGHYGHLPAQVHTSGSVGMMSTGSIAAPEMQQDSYAQLLHTRIVAQRTNLADLYGQRGLVDFGAASRAQADLQSVAQAAATDEGAHGGQLTAREYGALVARIQNVEQLINVADNS